MQTCRAVASKKPAHLVAPLRNLKVLDELCLKLRPAALDVSIPGACRLRANSRCIKVVLDQRCSYMHPLSVSVNLGLVPGAQMACAQFKVNASVVRGATKAQQPSSSKQHGSNAPCAHSVRPLCAPAWTHNARTSPEPKQESPAVGPAGVQAFSPAWSASHKCTCLTLHAPALQ